MHEEIRPGEDELGIALHSAALLHLHGLLHRKGHHARNTLGLHASTKLVSNLQAWLAYFRSGLGGRAGERFVSVRKEKALV